MLYDCVSFLLSPHDFHIPYPPHTHCDPEDKFLRRLEAVLLVADATNIYELTGNGDVLEPERGVMGVGSGGQYALAAALALVDQPGVDAETVVRKAMKIAGDICVYTNHNLLLEKLQAKDIAAGATTARPFEG